MSLCEAAQWLVVNCFSWGQYLFLCFSYFTMSVQCTFELSHPWFLSMYTVFGSDGTSFPAIRKPAVSEPLPSEGSSTWSRKGSENQNWSGSNGIKVSSKRRKDRQKKPLSWLFLSLHSHCHRNRRRYHPQQCHQNQHQYPPPPHPNAHHHDHGDECNKHLNHCHHFL